MVIRLEDSIVAVSAPSPGPHANLYVCQAVFESRRYFVYAIDSLLVILVEALLVSTTSTAAVHDQARCAPKFELWQVWNAQDPIKCVRYNTSKKAARGALAVCIEEGRGVLLMPISATSSQAAAVIATSRASSNLEDNENIQHFVALDKKLVPSLDDVKAHLHLHLPRWVESVRWTCEDHMLNRLEWVENRDDLLLLGAGQKLFIWKLVDDSVQVSLQRTVMLSREGDVSVVPLCYFDVASSGRFVATAGKHDRIVKVWDLQDMTPYEGTPMSLYLAHTRAIVCMAWSKETNVYNARSSVATTTGACEMLFTLDRSGNISIWKENVALLRSFVLWKRFAAADYCSSPFGEENDESVEIHMRAFGLLDHYWAQEAPKPMSSIDEALLSESTVMDALCLFHYGYGSLNEARRNELVSQRMDRTTHMNTTFLRDRSGTVADTHVGEAFICGNVALEQTFGVHLIYGVLSNGHFCIFRGASIPFTGASPRLSLLLCYTGLQEKLLDAHIYSVISSDYQDQASGSMVFFIELLFQQEISESYLQCARLKLQAENASVGTCQGSMFYTVLSCKTSVICSSMMNAAKEADDQDTSFIVANMAPHCESGGYANSSRSAVKLVATNIGGSLNVFRASESLRKLEIAFRSKIEHAVGPVTHTASYEEQSVLYLIIDGRLHVAAVAPCDTHQVEKVTTGSSAIPAGRQSDSWLFDAEDDVLALSMCYMDGSKDFEVLDELISIAIPESVKIKWSNSTICFAESATSKPAKDYSMVVGMHKGGTKLTVWVFSFEITVLESPASSVQLFCKTTVDLPDADLLGIATVPLLNPFELTLASFDAHLQLTFWTFADLDDLLEMTPAHRVDVGELIRSSGRAQNPHTEVHTTGHRLVFKHFSFSSCGRTAVLFGGGDSKCEDQICFLSMIESTVEGVVEIPHKEFGEVISLEWIPPVTPERNCDLVLLSTTTIATLKFDYWRPTNKWSIAWSSSRFSVRPKNILLSSYPYSLLSIGFSLAHLNLQDIARVRSSLLQLPPKNRPREQTLGAQPSSKVFPAHHPVILMYLLARGSFETLEKVLEHVKTKVLDHVEMCYLQMADDTELRSLPLVSLSQLLGDPKSTEAKRDERSDTYLKGKRSKKPGGISHCAASTGSARASDLFAMDFGAPCRYEASRGSSDRADMLFAPSSHDVPKHKLTASLKSKLETNIYPKFFNDHRSSLTFMTTEELRVFLTIVDGIKKVVSWERDSSRQKDEAALRFCASLLWPANCSANVQPRAADSDVPEQQKVSQTTAPTSFCLCTEGLCSEQVVWGALSDFQSELLHECFSAQTMSWKEMKRLRLPFWLRSSTKLIQFAEKVAQVEYATNRDPFGVAVFYVLLGKTRLLASLFKLAHESRISDLLGNNFSDMRWKNAAIKNAYVLMTKQRYELAAAFFLLGGKVIEAVSVAEQADESLVLSCLIARISEKWDLVQDEAIGSSGVAVFSQASLTDLATSFHGSAGTSSVVSMDDKSSESKHVCVDFLRTTVYEKALRRGDIYMCFLVRYLLGKTSEAIDILVAPPTDDMESMFDDCESSGMKPINMYWSAYAKSLLSACDLVRFLRKTLSPMKLTLKEKVLRLNTSAMLRMHSAGLVIAALLHQRDIASFVQKIRQECVTSSDVAAFLGCRQRVLIAAIGGQVDFLYAIFVHLMREAMKMPATSASSTRFDLEERVNEEIQCIVCHGGDYGLPGVLETSKKHLQHRVRAAIVESLIYSGHLAALDVLVAGWSHSESSSPMFAFASPLPKFVEIIAEGVATVASGDLTSPATDYLHTRKVDQTCCNMLATTTQLLLWLQYFYLKPPKQRGMLPDCELVRIAVAAVHSAISICCRYLKHPCCLYSVLVLINPHTNGFSSNLEKALKGITRSDICVNCASIRRSTTVSLPRRDASSFPQDIPMLYQVVRILERALGEFTAAVKTSRLHHPIPSRDSTTPQFSYCSFWELVLMMAADAMPAHLLNIGGEGVASTLNASKKLVEAWTNYSNRLASFALKHLLCDLAGPFFSPSSIVQPTSRDTTVAESPQRSSSQAQSGAPGSPRACIPDVSGSPPSPLNVSRNSRRLLKCECDHCPWLLLVELFTDRDKLLLRLNAQMEYCSEKINAEVWWGRLPEPAVRKAGLARSQKSHMSTAADNGLTLSRAINVTDQPKRCTMPTATATAVNVQCVYRSETSIKSMCVNRAAGGDTEMSVCTGKGIFRVSSMDYVDGCRFQFKGMYAGPHNSAFFPPDSTLSSPIKDSQTPDAMLSGNFGSGRQQILSPSLTMCRDNSRSPLRNPVHHLASPDVCTYGHMTDSVRFAPSRAKTLRCLIQQARRCCLTGEVSRHSSSTISASSLVLWMQGGHLFLWKFSELDRVPYYREMACHDKGAKGLTFLNSSSTIATAGLSSEKRNVCVWDTLLPTPTALVAAPTCHPAGATSVAFSSTHQLLITGGAGGALSIFDMRQRRVLHAISNAHETPIKALVLHPSGSCVLSGSASGDVKIWALPLFREVAFLSKVHVKPSFLGDAATNLLGDTASNVAINVTNSSWGVTDAIATKDAFFTSGMDGSVQRLKLPSLGTRL
ncbi:unnamed protein product [Peronospora belbahrii]|uniref:RAVE complex protein Rav1 C-terminal domain-containing protein n=1 Tax=Peronospora belbahrii TaxID=622444 RepID=A0AAU9KGI8_9STRA|nr:unnamed protein product [Peronospora belbahrii]